MRGMRVTARLAWRDARRHLARTLFALLLLSIPTAFTAGMIMRDVEAPLSRDSQLATLPDSAAALLTATAIAAPSVVQDPTGPRGPWMDDNGTEAASVAELQRVLPAHELVPYYRAEQLLATSGQLLPPGQARPVADVTAWDELRAHQLATPSLLEVRADLLPEFLPPLTAGRAAARPDEVVVSTALAQRTGVRVGQPLTLLAPPFSGWYSTTGRVPEVIADRLQSYTVVGIVAQEDEAAWSVEGLVADLVESDSRGIPRLYVARGEQPVTWQQVKELNALRAFGVSRHVLTHLPPPAELYPSVMLTAQAQRSLVISALTTLAGVLIVLGLVTPAFVVGSEQQRRSLALAAVTGATGRDLRRVLTLQGAALGTLGALLGTGGGTVLAAAWYRWRHPGTGIWQHLPWGLLALPVLGGLVMGYLMTWLPARRLAGLAPVEALKRRPRAAGSRRAARARLGAAAVSAGMAVLCAAAVLATPPPQAGEVAGPGRPVLLPLANLALLGFLTAVPLAAWLALPSLLQVLARARLPLVLRLAAREAHLHRSRTVPAATVVMVCLALASGLITVGTSFARELEDSQNSVVGAGHLVLYNDVPVADGFDRELVHDAIAHLRARLPVTGARDLYAVDYAGGHVYAAVPAAHQCGPDQGFTRHSARTLGASVVCVPLEQGADNGLQIPWMVGGEVFVMDGPTMRASGLPGAAKAAAVLERGGVVVRFAPQLEGGQARVVRAVGEEEVAAVRRPGHLLWGLAADVVVPPAVAAELGARLRYVGSYLETSRPLTGAETELAAGAVAELNSLVRTATRPAAPTLGGAQYTVPLAILTALGLAATVVAVALARAVRAADMATMHAVGASPGFLRRYDMAQAGVILLAGVPLGLAVGGALAVFQVLWLRRLGPANSWARIDCAPGWQALLVVGFTLLALAATWLVARPRRLTHRALD